MTNDDDTEFSEEDLDNENSYDLDISIQEFEDLFIAPSDWTVGSIIKMIGRQIDLDPAFQRRSVWSTAAKSRFIESILLNIPIPQILLASHKNERNNYLVLDGKQRLITISQFINGKLDNGRNFKLKGLRILTGLEGKTWEEIQSAENWADRFLDATIRTTILRGWKREETLYEIFYRLNSGSVKLSPMELRMSLHPGEFLKFMVQWTEELQPIHKLLRLSKPDRRMADVELTIKHLAFQEDRIAYKGNLKGFIDQISVLYNKEFDDEWLNYHLLPRISNFGQAISSATHVFGEDHICRKYKDGKFESRFNRAVYDIIIGSFSDERFRVWASQHGALVKNAFIELSQTDRTFVESFETSTKNIVPTTYRYKTWYKKVHDISGIQLTIPNIAAHE